MDDEYFEPKGRCEECGLVTEVSKLISVIQVGESDVIQLGRPDLGRGREVLLCGNCET